MTSKSTTAIDLVLTAVDRFVPPQLVQLAGAQGIAQLRLGQHVERPLSILFIDIQGYSSATAAPAMPSPASWT